MEKVVNGDSSVWGEPVVIDGVPVLPEVECLVPSWLRQEYFERTAFLALPEGQHFVYPGVRSPLLLPTDYIREYISLHICVVFLFLELLFVVAFKIVFIMLQPLLRCGLTSGCSLSGWVVTC